LRTHCTKLLSASREAEPCIRLGDHGAERRAALGSHDAELLGSYEQREAGGGDLSQLDGVLRCVNKRWKLLEVLLPKQRGFAPPNSAAKCKSEPSEYGRRGEEKAGPEGNVAKGMEQTGAAAESTPSPTAENAVGLHPMHCVPHARQAACLHSGKPRVGVLPSGKTRRPAAKVGVPALAGHGRPPEGGTPTKLMRRSSPCIALTARRCRCDSLRSAHPTRLVTVHGDCPDFRGRNNVASRNCLRRENGTVPLGRKATGTFFGAHASTFRDDQTGRKMSQPPAACERLPRLRRPRDLPCSTPSIGYTDAFPTFCGFALWGEFGWASHAKCAARNRERETPSVAAVKQNTLEGWALRPRALASVGSSRTYGASGFRRPMALTRRCGSAPSASGVGPSPRPSGIPLSNFPLFPGPKR